MGARAVGPWVGEQKPLGKSPLRGNPIPESTYLPTFPNTGKERFTMASDFYCIVDDNLQQKTLRSWRCRGPCGLVGLE